MRTECLQALEGGGKTDLYKSSDTVLLAELMQTGKIVCRQGLMGLKGLHELLLNMFRGSGKNGAMH